MRMRTLYFRAETDFIERLHSLAKRLGISPSAYVRMATSKEMDAQEAKDKPRLTGSTKPITVRVHGDA